jgi:L-ascorbate metabolism protein UlaG (beta-lactamase superfamily)
LLDTFTRNLCRDKQLPYPGPFTFSATPRFPAEPIPDPVVPCETRRGVITKAGSALRTRKPPAFADDAFLESVHEVRSMDFRQLPHPTPALWWLGRSGFLLNCKGRFVLLDPYLSAADPVIAPKRLDFLDIVACSCDRPDHFDPDTLRALVEVNPGLRIVCPAAHQELVRDTTGLSWDQITGVDLIPGDSPGSRFSAHPKAKVLGIRFIPVPAVWEGSTDPAPDACPARIGYLIHTGVGVVYFPGPTRPDGETVETLRRWEPQLALLPINGREADDPEGNYWGDEAAQLAKDIQTKFAIPCHHDLCTPDEFIAACRALHQASTFRGPGSA